MDLVIGLGGMVTNVELDPAGSNVLVLAGSLTEAAQPIKLEPRSADLRGDERKALDRSWQ